jgi:hypothetical protein
MATDNAILSAALRPSINVLSVYLSELVGTFPMDVRNSKPMDSVHNILMKTTDVIEACPMKFCDVM